MPHSPDNPSIFSDILNFYDVMVLTTTILAILLILPLLFKRERQKSDWLLSAFLFSQGATAFFVVMLYNKTLGPKTFAALYPFHFAPLTFLYGIQGFLLLWYSKAMMGKSAGLFSRDSIVGIVIIVLTILLGVFFEVSLESKLVVFMSIILGSMALIELRKYDRKIRYSYSNIDRIGLVWLRYSALGFVCVWVMVLVSQVSFGFGYKEFAIYLGTFKNIPPMLLMSAMVVFGQTHPLNAPLFDPDVSSGNNDKTDENPTLANPEQRNKLEDLMLRVKIYQDPELRLEGLADSMDISPRSVSSLLNGFYQKNFYDFINYYRVLDAQEQLKNPENKGKTVQRIFEDAGFNSKTTFNTLFKKLTGHTPTEYRKVALD